MEAVADFIFLGSKITADGTCRHEIKRRLLLERYAKPRQHIKKQRHYFAEQVPIIKAMVFPVVMYRCETWTIRKVQLRTDAFELWF